MNKGFPKELIPALSCAHDQGELKISQTDLSDDNTIREGELECLKCQKKYQIKNGIFYFIANQKKLEALLQDEITARDKEADSYDKRLAVRYYKEIPTTMSAFNDLKNKKIIEYGCGTGRLTEALAKEGGMIMAIDFSLSSLEILAKKLENNHNLGLVLGDAINFATNPSFFDYAFAAQFYEHIPTPEQRHNFIANANNSLVNGGKLIMSVYHQDLRRRMKKEPKEGIHGSGIFFKYFLDYELEKDVIKKFVNVHIKKFDISLPLEARLKFLPLKLKGCVSRICERLPVINDLGHLMLVSATKK